jgi:hypothetical protein
MQLPLKEVDVSFAAYSAKLADHDSALIFR